MLVLTQTYTRYHRLSYNSRTKLHESHSILKHIFEVGKKDCFRNEWEKFES